MKDAVLDEILRSDLSELRRQAQDVAKQHF